MTLKHKVMNTVFFIGEYSLQPCQSQPCVIQNKLQVKQFTRNLIYHFKAAFHNLRKKNVWKTRMSITEHKYDEMKVQVK